MSIGTTIKRLRRERSITQEQLAEYLGISTGAVSQWECDRTAPDITQIPVLANIFEVSADILLEIDVGKSKRAKEIVHFERQCDMLHHQGKNEDRLLLCREMVKKYPNDEAVLFQLMKALKATRENECYSEIITLFKNHYDLLSALQLYSRYYLNNTLKLASSICLFLYCLHSSVILAPSLAFLNGDPYFYCSFGISANNPPMINRKLRCIDYLILVI